MLVDVPNQRNTQDLSLTSFVDNPEKTTILQYGAAREIHDNTKQSNGALDRHLDTLGFAQNRDKETIIPVLFGPESRDQLRQLFETDHRVAVTARYLGILHHQHLSTDLR